MPPVSTGLKGLKNGAPRAAKNLKADFPAAGLERRGRRGRGDGCAAGKIAGRDEGAG